MALRWSQTTIKQVGFLFLIIGGLLGNYFNVPLMFGVNLVFGSIFALIAVQVFGVAAGGLAAAVISSYTIFLWGHPYGFILMTSEAMFVGILKKRIRKDLAVCDAVYWLFLGVPGVWLLYRYGMGMDTTATVLIMLKQAVNGVVNAVIASSLLVFFPHKLYRRTGGNRQQSSLCRIVFSILSLSIIVPALVFMTVSGRVEYERMNDQVRSDIEGTFLDARNVVATWRQQQFNAVSTLARLAGDLGFEDPRQLQAVTEHIQEAYPDFHNMYIADASGTTVAFSPSENGRGESTIGLDFSDREYFTAVKKTLQPFVSDVFVGRGGVASPIAALCVPIVVDNKFAGIALGAVRLDRVAELVQLRTQDRPSHLTIVDRNGLVVASTSPTVSPLDDVTELARNSRAWAEILEAPTETLAAPPQALPTMLQWKDSALMVRRPLEETAPWSLVVEYPMGALQKELYQRYTMSLAVMGIVILAALFMGHLAHRYLARPLSQLARLTTDLPQQVYEDQTIEWPKVFGPEMQTLVSNFGEMTQSLKASFRDVCAAREQIEYDALHDPLTGLPNRRYLQQIAFNEAGRPKDYGVQAMLFVDLDRFSLVNNSLGHDVGDTFLREVAKRLVSCVHEGDVVIRQGGDEFLLWVAGHTMNDFGHVAQTVLDRLSQPFTLDSEQFYVSASIGISIYPLHGDTLTELIRQADSAMYDVKKNGGNDYKICNNACADSTAEQLRVQSELRDACTYGQFLLYYQPQIDISTRRIVGMEALLRWNRPGLGVVLPAEFVPLLEESPLIGPVTEWILREACRQTVKWQKEAASPLKIAVNLSPRQLNEEQLYTMVRKALEESGLSPSCLELEITERHLIQDRKRAGEILHRLADLGVTIALDDFGTGFSSLQHLKQLPINVIKIDKMFVQGIELEPNDRAIVTATVAMAHNLGMKAIAEGVEKEAHLEYLKSIGCDVAQGYYFCRPVAEGEFEKFLEEWNGMQCAV